MTSTPYQVESVNGVILATFLDYLDAEEYAQYKAKLSQMQVYRISKFAFKVAP